MRVSVTGMNVIEAGEEVECALSVNSGEFVLKKVEIALEVTAGTGTIQLQPEAGWRGGTFPSCSAELEGGRAEVWSLRPPGPLTGTQRFASIRVKKAETHPYWLRIEASVLRVVVDPGGGFDTPKARSLARHMLTSRSAFTPHVLFR